MIVVMRKNAGADSIARVRTKLEQAGFALHQAEMDGRIVISAIGDRARFVEMPLEAIEGVDRVVPLLHSFAFVGREVKPTDTVVNVGGVAIGGKRVVVMAGPCAVENREQIITAAREVKQSGARILRGGAFKPRTSPYSFQGLGKEGLELLAEARRKTGLPVVTEVLAPEHVELVAEHSDMLQIGARNMQNFALLQEVGQQPKPVLLKRGMAATIEEWLSAAEYIVARGNSQVVLCERGIRTFSTYTRNTLDLSSVAVAKQLSHLPVVVDPSHGTGRWRLVSPMSRAAVAAGADGLLVEVHPKPEQALSDGAQSLTPANFAVLMRELKRVAKAVDRDL